MLTSNAFREDDFTHDQVFGDVHREPFSVPEAAEYLEVSVATLRRYMQSGRLRPSQIVGRSQFPELFCLFLFISVDYRQNSSYISPLRDNSI